jgi:hypothetical protein
MKVYLGRRNSAGSSGTRTARTTFRISGPWRSANATEQINVAVTMMDRQKERVNEGEKERCLMWRRMTWLDQR